MGVLDSLFDVHRQETRLLRLCTTLGQDVLLAEAVQGEEAISGAYRFTISALSIDAAIPLKQLLGQPALLDLAIPGPAGRRPFHGHLTRVRFDGADGGLARYTLSLEPWTAFMARGRDSRTFQNMTVPEVLDAVFAPYCRQRPLAPAWRFDLLERGVYPVRSLVTQYQESDLAFAERLMCEEGMFYFFEHAGDRDDPQLGRHELVIADHNGTFKPAPQDQVRFTGSGANLGDDGIDLWSAHARALTTAVDVLSWDYRTLDSRPVGARTEPDAQGALASRDAPGHYGYPGRVDGERIARRQLEAIGARREVYSGEGEVRTLAPGATFSLLEHPAHDLETGDHARRFLVTRVWHAMRNNLSADERAAVTADADGRDEPMYRQRIEAIRAQVPYRASAVDGHGRLLHPRPTVLGQQTAIVVGPDGAVIHTDRDHRIKVQFHWQRGTRSHNRLQHPHPERATGAPSDDAAGTWVRVAGTLAPIAGGNWGSVAPPRVGQEVLVDFLDGDIDRPVVIAALYNGRGAPDAQHNEVNNGAGVATGDAPVWFPGASGAHAHPAVLSGFKSQAMAASQSGAGAYSQLVFDSTAGQQRVSLQRHDQAHRGNAEVNLGYLRHQTDNQRLGAVGFGAEVKTDYSVGVRAGMGLFLRTFGRARTQMGCPETHAQLTSSSNLAEKLANIAETHGVENRQLKYRPRTHELKHETGAHAKQVPSWTNPDVTVSSGSGIVAVTPAQMIAWAGGATSITAAESIEASITLNYAHSTALGIRLFTRGVCASDTKPEKGIGIKLHSGTGRLRSRSHSGPTIMVAEKMITVASINSSVTISAPKHALLTAQGAALRIEGGNIELIAPRDVFFAAAMKELCGPKSVCRRHVQLPPVSSLSNVEKTFSTRVDASSLITDFAVHGRGEYAIKLKDGSVVRGNLDEYGRTRRIFVDTKDDVEALIGDGEWEIVNNAEYD